MSDNDARHYIEQRLREGGLKLVRGSSTMLSDELARFNREEAARAALSEIEPQGVRS